MAALASFSVSITCLKFRTSKIFAKETASSAIVVGNRLLWSFGGMSRFATQMSFNREYNILTSHAPFFFNLEAIFVFCLHLGPPLLSRRTCSCTPWVRYSMSSMLSCR